MEFNSRKEQLLEMFREMDAELRQQFPSEKAKSEELEGALAVVIEDFVHGRTNARLIKIPDGNSTERALVSLLGAVTTCPDADQILARQMERIEKISGNPVLKDRVYIIMHSQRNLLERLSPADRDISKLIRQPNANVGVEHNTRA